MSHSSLPNPLPADNPIPLSIPREAVSAPPTSRISFRVLLRVSGWQAHTMDSYTRIIDVDDDFYASFSPY